MKGKMKKLESTMLGSLHMLTASGGNNRSD